MTPRLWAVAGLLVWGGAILFLGLIRLDEFGVDESAARALLLVWSVVDRIINPIFIIGMPDLRALLFVPAGIYWPGSITAIKVLTIIIAYAGALFVYQWSQRRQDHEHAMLTTGLLLLSPIMITQIDEIGAGPYLLLLFGLGCWIDAAYRRSQRTLGGWFFLQLLIVMIATSIHPIALAYPIALVMEWYRHPVDSRHQRHVYIGLGCAVIFSQLLHPAWPGQDWLQNPLTVLASSLLGPTPDSSPEWPVGFVIASVLIPLMIRDRRLLVTDLLYRMIFFAIVIGLFAADQTWNLIIVSCLLILGINFLIDVNKKLGGHSFAGQRGLVMLVVFITATVFMQGDKAHQTVIDANRLDPHDKLIQTLAAELEDNKDKSILIMSQWPGKTMLATRRPVVPLPPDYKDTKTLLKNINKISHIIFDPRTANNRSLSRQLSTLSAQTETIALERGGVIIQMRHAETHTADTSSGASSATKPAR